MQLLVKRLQKEAILPARATQESAGLDLCACLEEPVSVLPGETVRIPTGLALGLQLGTAGFVYPRSGLSTRFGISLANCVGVIDSDYRGEVQVPVVNRSAEAYTIRHGDRIAQLVVAPVFLPEVYETDTLDETERGEGGFGSTGYRNQ